jgi:hypothetical protein
MIEIPSYEATALMGTSKYPMKVFAKIDFPSSLVHNDKLYYITGKVGRGIKDGMPSAEYETGDSSRVWLRSDGEVIND